MSRWQLLDVSEERRVESPVTVEEKKIANRADVEAICYVGMRAESGDCVAKDKGRSNPGVIEKFYAEMVTCAEKRSRAAIPDRERKVPDHMVQTRFTPFKISAQN